jgi:hypothetical protein
MHRKWGLSILLATGVLFALGGGPAMARPRGPIAHPTSTLTGTATTRLHLVKAEGSELIEAGPVSGILLGSASAKLRTGALFEGNFSIHTPSGNIQGTGTATPHSSGRYQSFAGSFLAVGGSGRYARITGKAKLYGVFDRRTDSVVIQTVGSLRY